MTIKDLKNNADYEVVNTNVQGVNNNIKID